MTKPLISEESIHQFLYSRREPEVDGDVEWYYSYEEDTLYAAPLFDGKRVFSRVICRNVFYSSELLEVLRQQPRATMRGIDALATMSQSNQALYFRSILNRED